jgi:hypothetical protein
MASKITSFIYLFILSFNFAYYVAGGHLSTGELRDRRNVYGCQMLIA